MRIRTTETFEQKYKNPTSKISHPFGNVEYLKFAKGQVYHFFVVPKVMSIDLEKDEAEIDYPFEEVITHFGAYPFMAKYANMQSERINCRGCAIEEWMSENRLPKSVFKIAIGTQFQLAYTIHEKRVKVAWFQDYLYGAYLEQIAKLMNEKEISLFDALRHRVKLFTSPSGNFDIEIDKTVTIPVDSSGFKNILALVHQKSLDTFIETVVETDRGTIDSVLHALKDYTEKVIKEEKVQKSREKMEIKSQNYAAIIDALKDPEEDSVKTNGIITDENMSVGPESLPDEEPF